MGLSHGNLLSCRVPGDVSVQLPFQRLAAWGSFTGGYDSLKTNVTSKCGLVFFLAGIVSNNGS